MQAAIDCRPHQSAHALNAITQLQEEVEEMMKAGQSKMADWLDFKDNLPFQLKIFSISMILPKSQKYFLCVPDGWHKGPLHQ